MKSAFNVCIMVITLGLLLAACHTQPIYQVQGHPVTQVAQNRLTDEQMTQIILDAAAMLRWQASVVQPGRIRATVNFGSSHSAACDVIYSRQSYSILLASSYNLKEDGRGNIHVRYNQAVRQLEEGIERGVLRASY